MHCVLQDRHTTLGAIDYLPAYGLSALRAGTLPVIGFEPASAAAGAVRVSIPEIEYAASLTARQHNRTATLPLASIETILSTIHRPLSAFLRWDCGATSGSLPLTLLPPWSWPLLPETRLHLATFVLPDDGLALAAGVAQGDRTKVRRTCTALYAKICDIGRIRYENPRVQDEPWSGTAHQSIRPTAEILAVPSSRDVGANCVDLSILFASALEACGVNPLLVLVGDRNAPPEHCLVGAWTIAALRFRPLLDDRDALVAHLDAGDLLLWESTGVCAGDTMDFASAKRRAAETLRRNATIQMIDVSAARPPAGSCAPLFVGNAPVVARAFLEAQQLADEFGSRRREAAHLLCGVCRAGGELTLWLFERAGTSAAAVAALVRERLPREGFTGSSTPTRNFLTCVSAARANARYRGAASVDESDLLWALLENPSDTVRQLVEACGCRLSQLQRELATRADRPGEATTHRSIYAEEATTRPSAPEPRS